MFPRLIFHANFAESPDDSQVFFVAALSKVLNSNATQSGSPKIGASFGCFLATRFELENGSRVSASQNPFFLAAGARDPFDIEKPKKVAALPAQFPSQTSLERVIDLSMNGGAPLGDDDIVVILGHGNGSTISALTDEISKFTIAINDRAVASRTRSWARNWFASLLSLQAKANGLDTTAIANGLGANKPGLIILHSCFAGTLEFAYGLRASGKHLLASPANLLVRDIGYGKWLDNKYANKPVPKIADSARYLVDLVRSGGGELALLALYDLSKFEALKTSLKSFLDAAKFAVAQDTVGKPELVSAMNSCYKFDLPDTALKAIDLHQFGQFAGGIPVLATDAKNLCDAAQACVVARSNDGNGIRSGSGFPNEVIGLSIILPKEAYLPDALHLESIEWDAEILKMNFPVAFSTGWLSFLRNGGAG